MCKRSRTNFAISGKIETKNLYFKQLALCYYFIDPPSHILTVVVLSLFFIVCWNRRKWRGTATPSVSPTPGSFNVTRCCQPSLGHIGVASPSRASLVFSAIFPFQPLNTHSDGECCLSKTIPRYIKLLSSKQKQKIVYFILFFFVFFHLYFLRFSFIISFIFFNNNKNGFLSSLLFSHS